MKQAGLAAMEDDRPTGTDLVSAGYTTPRAAIWFCAVLACLGALVGSVVFAILWNVAVPGRPELATLIGSTAGAVLGVLLGIAKVSRGNHEAREEALDKAWRRNEIRNLGRREP